MSPICAYVAAVVGAPSFPLQLPLIDALELDHVIGLERFESRHIFFAGDG